MWPSVIAHGGWDLLTLLVAWGGIEDDSRHCSEAGAADCFDPIALAVVLLIYAFVIVYYVSLVVWLWKSWPSETTPRIFEFSAVNAEGPQYQYE